jgi:hypothetical protein
MSSHSRFSRLFRARPNPCRSGSRLAVEALEGRLSPAVLTVNSTADTANPSDPYLTFPEAIALFNSPSLPSGLSDQILAQIRGGLHDGGTDRIEFDPDAVSTPIVLTGFPFVINLPASTAALTIDGGPAGTVVEGLGLEVQNQVQATLDHLVFPSGAFASNLGSLTVSHCTLGSAIGSSRGGLSNNSPGSLTVEDSTFTGFSGNVQGGCIRNFGPTVTVSNSTFTRNVSDQGGVIYNQGGTVTVRNSTLTGNSSPDGGALDTLGGTVTVSNSTLSANSGSQSGGAIATTQASVTVSDSTLTANSGRLGGGIYNEGSQVTVTDSTLASNSGYTGGGVFNEGTLTLSRSTLESNSATFIGGGIYNTVRVTVDDSTLSANSAGSEGGGLDNFSGSITMSNCTLSANSAGQNGGGLSTGTLGRVLLRNTIMAGNRSTSNPDINGTVDSTSSYNLVGDGTGLSGISDGMSHNQVGTAASPIDPRLSPLGYYGGPTQTQAVLPGSPALAAGDPTASGTDQRGQRLPGPGNDIGAFQTQADPFLVTTLTDPGRQPGLLSLREAVGLANVLPGDNTVSFTDALDGGAVSLTAGQLELSGSGGVLTIDGASRFSLDGGNATRLVQVDPDTTAVLRGLAVVNGNAPTGAGVYNRGSLTVADCVLYGNTGYAGGAVLNQGDLTVWGCTLAFNVATLGAAIDNEGRLTAYNATLLYNAALGSGGAILNQPSGTAVLTSLTISRNSADSGGGLDVAGGLVLLRNCIVAGNYSTDASAASDIAGTVAASSPYNLIGTGGSGGLLDGVSHNLVGVADPGLTTPDFSGPQTPVFGFTDDSPALAAGDPTLLSDPVLRLDQHGNVRTVVNIGAV